MKIAQCLVLMTVVAGCQCSEPSGDDHHPPGEGNDAGTHPNGEPGGPPDIGIVKADCIDFDGDGFGIGALCRGFDCDDSDPAIGNEASRSCYPGQAGTEGVGVCAAGTQLCTAGFWGACGGYTVPQIETCDGTDNNCNGQLDENITRVRQDGSNQGTEPVYRPVDIILVVDNSGSMTDEIVAVQNNINNSLASIIGQSGLDYRVILLSEFGSASADQSICVLPPLSGNPTCTFSASQTPPTCPTNGPRFFQYPTEIGSTDSLDVITRTYSQPDRCNLAPGGWKGWLRPGAARVFVEITDDGPSTAPRSKDMNATDFDAALLALSPAEFGTTGSRDYVFHSIVGLHQNSPNDLDAWLPSDPLVTTLCTANGGHVVNPGTEYQKLSQWTGGLRYPVCEYQSFDAIFRAVATGIVQGAQMTCAFNVTNPPADSNIDNTILEFTPTNGGAVDAFTHVKDEASCAGDAFYTVNNEIHLCPDACAKWRGDPTAFVDVSFTCSNQVQ